MGDVLHDIAEERGEINRRKLGWWIRRHAGRIVDGRRFVRVPGNQGEKCGEWNRFRRFCRFPWAAREDCQPRRGG